VEVFSMKRYLMIASGRVQGVGFRYFALYAAKSLNLTGTVRNQSNGNVEIFVQGNEVVLDKFKSQLMKGNAFIKVEDLFSKEIPLEEKEKDFKVIY